MGPLTPSQRAWRTRVDVALIVLGPPLDLVLGVAERASRLLAGGPSPEPPSVIPRAPLAEPRR